MKEHQILFSGPMVRALLNGTKTQTRRLINNQPDDDCGSLKVGLFNPTVIDSHGDEQPGDERFGAWTLDGERGWVSPYGQPGDRLWVRETFQRAGGNTGWRYKATDGAADNGHSPVSRWIPSIHMPRKASRITLEITSIRVERLQDISEADALAEGIARSAALSFSRTGGVTRPAGLAYRDLWEQIYGASSWDLNLFVWVVEFKRVEGGAA
jgi:hypothetical protein